MRFLLFICYGIAGFLFVQIMTSTLAQSDESNTAPVVVELFTSQSCSSCPPADSLLGTLAESKNVIALSCNVTYWNHLHWEDTLSQDFCTQRQRQYTQTLKSRGPYTPQMVINGIHDVVGNRTNQVTKTVQAAATNDKVLPIALTKTGDSLQINLPHKAGITQPVTLLLIHHGDKHTQSIPSGENRGRTVSYTNPVTKITSLGQWDGQEGVITHALTQHAAGYVVMAQGQNGYGNIIAAGQIKN